MEPSETVRDSFKYGWFRYRQQYITGLIIMSLFFVYPEIGDTQNK